MSVQNAISRESIKNLKHLTHNVKMSTSWWSLSKSQRITSVGRIASRGHEWPRRIAWEIKLSSYFSLNQRSQRTDRLTNIATPRMMLLQRCSSIIVSTSDDVLPGLYSNQPPTVCVCRFYSYCRSDCVLHSLCSPWAPRSRTWFRTQRLISTDSPNSTQLSQ